MNSVTRCSDFSDRTRCSLHGCPAVFRGSQQVPQRRTDALFSRLSQPDEHLAPQRWLGSLGRATPRPLNHSHLKKHTAVARATAGTRCWPAGAPARDRAPAKHPPRAILAAHEVKHLDHMVSRSSYRVKLLLQLPKRVPAPSFSTGLALSSVDSLRRQGTQGTR